MRKLAVGIGIAVALGGMACSRSGSVKAASWEKCMEKRDAEACVAWGRSLLASEPLTAEQGDLGRKRVLMARDWAPSDEMIGIAGASIVKLGGFYAGHGDVLKGVDMVEEGLKLISDSLQARPASKTLRIYYASTLSHLPADFQKGQEALDTLDGLQARFPLDPEEKAEVAAARSRIKPGG